MKIIATKTELGALEAGDTYSEISPEAWAAAENLSSLWCYVVLIRSNYPLPESVERKTVYKLEIIKEPST